MIPKGTVVDIKTTNGGHCVSWLLENYRPTYDAVIRINGEPVVITADRLKSIEPLTQPKGTTP